MARRLTHEESRAIKRTMRATPRISQRMHDGWLDDDGRFVIKAGRPPIGQLLEATRSAAGKWSVEVVDMWEADPTDTRQAAASRKNDPKAIRASKRSASPKWSLRSSLIAMFVGALFCAVLSYACGFHVSALTAIAILCAFFAAGIALSFPRAKTGFHK